jgi:hypothetical protein
MLSLTPPPRAAVQSVLFTCRLKDHFARFEVFTVVTMKNAAFWDVTPCGSCKNRRFGGTSVLTRRRSLKVTLFDVVHEHAHKYHATCIQTTYQTHRNSSGKKPVQASHRDDKAVLVECG